MRSFCKFCGLIILGSIFSGCQTTEPELIESISFEQDREIVIKSTVKIPVVEIFISAPLIKEPDIYSIDASDIQIPDEEVPLFFPDELEEDKAVKRVPIVTNVENVEREDDPQIIVKDIAVASVDIEDVSQEVVSTEEKTADTETFSESIQTENNKEIIIMLDKEGWIYDGLYPSYIVKMKSREFTGDKTVFIFTISEDGEYILKFYLQDLNSGLEESADYNILVSNPLNHNDEPVVIYPEEADPEVVVDSFEPSDLTLAVEEENIPDIISSFNQIISDTEPLDSLVVLDAFNLLEQQGGYSQYLVDLAERNYQFYPYNNMSAEMLYRAAVAIEQPGPLQNIEKALALFKLVRDNFPISIFCDKSEERIRYLERHFMKIY